MCEKVLGSVLSIGAGGGCERDRPSTRVVLEELQLLKVISYSVVAPPIPQVCVA